MDERDEHAPPCTAAEDALHRRLRLALLRRPLAMPLLGVVGALLAGQWWVLALASFLLPLALGLRRMALCALLCAALAALHADWRGRVAQSFHEASTHSDTLCCRGTVVDRLARGCILEPEGGGTFLALRGETPFSEGDFVRVHFAPREPAAPPVPGMFDRRIWMESRGIAMEADFLHGERLGQPFSWASVRAVARGIRDELAGIIMPPGTEDDARRQVLAALVLGAREHAQSDTMVGFRRSGSLHAFAVSGQHVALFAGILWVLLRLLRVPPATGRWAQLAVLGFYVVVTGFSVPAVRAYAMLATLLLGLSLRRRVSLLNAWCFAALLVLLIEPWQLSNAGFLLSFGIYAAICAGIRLCMGGSAWIGPDPFIPPRLYTPGERRLAAWDYALRGTVIISLCAWLVSLPLTATLFHTFNTLGFLTNILIAPLVFLVMLAGLAMLALAWAPWLGGLAAGGALLAAQLLLGLCTGMGALPHAYLPACMAAPPDSAMAMGLGYGHSFCVLGNPGLVIDCGNEDAARFRVEPALFHAGYRPELLLPSRDTRNHSGGAGVLRLSWPQLQQPVLRGKPLCFSGKAGSFTLYPPPRSLPRSPAANQAPVVLWEAACGRRVLYIGDASAATVATLPPQAQKADLVILGRNPKRPMEDAPWLRASGARCVLLLPSAAGSPLQPEHIAPARLIRMDDEASLDLGTLF